MSYYFKNGTTVKNTKTVPTQDYTKLKADYLQKLEKGITSRTKASELRRELLSLSEVVRAQYKDPEPEVLILIDAYKAAIDKAVEKAEAKYAATFEEAEKVKSKTYIERISPELDATVNSLALSYMNKLHTMHGQASKQDALFLEALKTREGAMALLRIPADVLPSRIKLKAVDATKTPEQLAFEEQQKLELASLGRESFAAYSDGFHMRNIRQNIEKERTRVISDISRRENNAV